jgi:hypothetical protein
MNVSSPLMSTARVPLDMNTCIDMPDGDDLMDRHDAAPDAGQHSVTGTVASAAAERERVDAYVAEVVAMITANDPRIVNFLDLPSTPRFCLPEVVVEGIIHAGSKVTVGGPPKAKKSWLFHDLVVSVASGQRFLGRACSQGRVLLIDLELLTYFLDQRVRAVAAAKGVGEEVFENIDVFPLRGHGCNLELLIRNVLRSDRRYSLIVIDPLYRLLAGLDDNQAKEMTKICHLIEHLATAAGAAVLIGMHFSKGNPANKSSMDRIAGSGVWARDADTIITLTPHRDADRFIAEFTLRNFSPVPPLVVGWEHPLYVPNPDIAPFFQQTARRHDDFPAEEVQDKIMEILSAVGSINKGDLIDRVKDLGYPRDPIRELIGELVEEGLLQQTGTRPIVISIGGAEEAAA